RTFTLSAGQSYSRDALCAASFCGGTHPVTSARRMTVTIAVGAVKTRIPQRRPSTYSGVNQPSPPSRSLNERRHLLHALFSGRQLHGARRIDAVGQHLSDAGFNVFRLETTREDEFSLFVQALNERPIKGVSC